MTNRKTESNSAYISYLDGDVLYVLPDPAAFADPRVQVALALRNQATLSNRCPACGARGPNRAERRRLKGVASAVIWHEPECPAGNENLRRLIAESGEAAA